MGKQLQFLSYKYGQNTVKYKGNYSPLPGKSIFLQ